MDAFYHGLTGLLISKSLTGDYLASALVFATLPDLLGTSPFQYFKLKNSSKKSLKIFIDDFIKHTKRNRFFTKIDRASYRTTHGLFSLFFVVILSYVLFKNIWQVLTLCYLSHLFIDALTHEGEFAFRPFWPFSNFNLKGKSWANYYIFLSFWIVLIIAFLIQLYTFEVV